MGKNILIFLLLLTSCGLSFGKAIDENTAKTIGSNFLINEGKAVKASDLSLAYQATSVVNGGTVTDFYVFNAANDGFVIVAGDDHITPVLGYDLASVFSFNNLFVNVNGYLNTYKKEINNVIKNNKDATPATIQQWSMLQGSAKTTAAKTTVTGVPPLVHVQWNQTPFVNALCPVDPTQDSLTLTGCVATAMAQLMKYWGWPVTGTGSHSYNSSYGLLSADYSAETYKWDSMPILINHPDTFVAKLMLDAGVSVDMQYGLAESGAYVTEFSSPVTNCAEYALQTYFSYMTSTIQGVNRPDYDDSDWVTLLKSEITAKRPVIYTGDGAQGGHCFLADGYTVNDLIHFNWGWGGSCNGYYIIENLDPGGDTFDDDQTLIIGIMPDTVSLSPTVPTSPAGIQQVVTNSSVNIYPNPASDDINIALQGTKVTEVRLTDVQGRVLTSLTPATSASIITIPVNNFAEGMYFVQLQTATGTLTKKIVVAR